MAADYKWGGAHRANCACPGCGRQGGEHFPIVLAQNVANREAPIGQIVHVTNAVIKEGVIARTERVHSVSRRASQLSLAAAHEDVPR